MPEVSMATETVTLRSKRAEDERLRRRDLIMTGTGHATGTKKAASGEGRRL